MSAATESTDPASPEPAAAPSCVVNDPETVAEVRAFFEAYERALLSNDVPALVSAFWKSAHAVRYGVGENLYGFDAIRDFRRGRRTGPFDRTLRNTTITTFGRDFAVANTEYQREGHDRPGRESKTLVRTRAGWRIAAAHVSLMGETV